MGRGWKGESPTAVHHTAVTVWCASVTAHTSKVSDCPATVFLAPSEPAGCPSHEERFAEDSAEERACNAGSEGPLLIDLHGAPTGGLPVAAGY